MIADPLAITQVSRIEPRDYFGTATGGKAYLTDPARSDIRLSDIAIALSNICRFGGHAPWYSVAQHSVLVSYLAPPPFKLCALFHDATEAYLGDVISPLKRLLGESYASIERRWEGVIALKFGYASQLVWRSGVRGLPLEVKAADQRAFELECWDLLAPSVRARAVPFQTSRPDGPRIFPISSEQARQAWLRRYWTLTADSPAPSRQSHILGAEERA